MSNIAITASGLVRSLQSRIDECLRTYLHAGTPVAHVGYPHHWNAGDPAIWLGTHATLRRLGCKLVYQCFWRDYDRDLMARELGTGTILINGGGNLGDLWPNHQLFRERILQDFPDNPVLQLPQSMFFGERSALKRFQDICTRHPNFHILLRDRTSLNLATELLDVPVSLCPDMAFGLGPLSRPADPHTDIFWLSRTDKESLGRQPLDRVERQDWLEQCSADDIGDWAAAKCKRDLIEHILGALCNRPRDSAQLLDEVANAYESLAWIGVNRGLRMLAQGRVIITDRLHGHILGLCLNIPQIVMDNSYHKISSFIETWTQQSPITHWANSPEHALMQARELLGHTT